MSFVTFYWLIVSSVFMNFVTVDAILKPDLPGPNVDPVFSPFDENGQVDLEAIRPYAAYLFKNKIRTVHLFKPNAGEPYSVNLCESKCIINEWLRVNKENRYGFSFIVGLSFLTAKDSCALAAFSEQNNIAALSFTPSGDAGPKNASDAANDLSYIASCAPSTPIFLGVDLYFPTCYPVINWGITHSIAIASIPNYAGIIAPLGQCSLAIAYDPNRLAIYMVSYYYSVAPADILQFDYHSTVFANIAPSVVNLIDSARSFNATSGYQDKLNSIATRLCDMRPDCRLPCPMNILKAAFRHVSNIYLYPRQPLCKITPEDVAATRIILRQEGLKLIN